MLGTLFYAVLCVVGNVTTLQKKLIYLPCNGHVSCCRLCLLSVENCCENIDEEPLTRVG